MRAASGSRAATVATFAGSPRAATRASPSFRRTAPQIAFTGDYDGTRGVYVVAAAGGVPRRLTFHPADGSAIGWTPDGKQILFTSERASFARGVVQLFTVPVTGGFATPVPLVRAARRLVFARLLASRLRSDRAVAASLETLPWRTDSPHLDRETFRLKYRSHDSA